VAAWAPLAYDGPARALVRGLKFGGAAGLSEVMAAQMAANAPEGLLAGFELVPVPLHPRRRRKRGYNQAERLASALAARSGLVVSDCLVRRGSSAAQVGRRRAQRLEAIAGRVALKDGAEAPARALIVDDVITTGATVAACAEALYEAGSEEVLAVAYARTQGR
jgi:ComF family protein